MATKTVSTRRSFISVAGMALSAPLAAGVAGAAASPVAGGDDLKARLAMLEDLDAIRTLTQAFARHVNAGAHDEIAALFADPSGGHIDPSIHGIDANGFGEHDVIDIAPDRQTATARLYCTVHTETAIGPSCPLVDMARQQGGGVVRLAEPGVFENLYVKRDGMWKIQRSTHRPA